MIHLSGVDASFLHLETPEMPMHVGSLHIIELPKGYSGDFYEDFVSYVSSRMHLAKVFERKLAQMPFEMSNPVWVDDDDIDIEYHIRRVVLSKPATMPKLEALAGRLHSSLLDRSRPLWEMYVIEGLESGHVALYAKVHHAAIDGQAGVALAKALYDITPEPRPVRKPRQKPRGTGYQLGVAELASAAVQNTFQQYVKLVTTLPNAMRAMASVTVPAMQQLTTQMFKLPLALPGALSDMASFNPSSFDIGSSLGIGPRTPLNVSITNQRSFAGRSVSLADAKAVAKRAGVSLNDVVMAACSGALRRYMKELDVPLDRSMTAAIPVSLREAGNEDPNNQVTMMLASLATDEKDPLARLKAINASTTSSKAITGAYKAAIPTDFPSFGAPWIMTGLATLFGRSKLSDQIPPVANVAISNVPGVPVPLYVAGAKLLTYFPVSIPAHGCALNITVQSYNGSLDYGLTACRRACPDVAELADYIVEAHAELQRLVMALPAPAAPAKTAAAVQPTAPQSAAPPAIEKAAPVAVHVLPEATPVARAANGNGHAAPSVKKKAAARVAEPKMIAAASKSRGPALHAPAAKGGGSKATKGGKAPKGRSTGRRKSD